MKQAVLIGTILLLLVGGYFIFSQEAQAPQEELTQNKSEENLTALMPLSGVVTHVDLDGAALDGPALVTFETTGGIAYVIAIPSIGIRHCAAYENIASGFDVTVGDRVRVKGDVDAAGRIVPCEDSAHYLEVTSIYENDEIGFSFEYETGAGGYVFEDGITGFSEHSAFVYGIMLTERGEYEALHSATDAREGPPTIQVRVLENTEKQSPFVWIERNPLESNINLKIGDVEEADVGGANAAHYIVDGLFRTDTYAVAHNGYIFLLAGMAFSPEDDIARDFVALVDSFTFIPTQAQFEASGEVAE